MPLAYKKKKKASAGMYFSGLPHVTLVDMGALAYLHV